jgi:hypothetical protein
MSAPVGPATAANWSGPTSQPQLERLEDGAAPGDDLSAALADQVERGEILVQPDRVEGGQHGHGAGQPDRGRGLQVAGEARPGVRHGRRLLPRLGLLNSCTPLTLTATP